MPTNLELSRSSAPWAPCQVPGLTRRSPSFWSTNGAKGQIRLQFHPCLILRFSGVSRSELTHCPWWSVTRTKKHRSGSSRKTNRHGQPNREHNFWISAVTPLHFNSKENCFGILPVTASVIFNTPFLLIIGQFYYPANKEQPIQCLTDPV